MSSQRNPGRPKTSGEDRKDVIALAAANQFSKQGFGKTTIRSVALEAGVDPKLVMHYFGNKLQLFAATMEVPDTADRAIKILKVTPKPLLGQALAEAIFAAEKSDEVQKLVGIIRAAASEEAAGEMIRELYLKKSLMRIVAALKLENPELRAVMLAAVITGYVFTSRIVPLQDLAAVSDAKRKKLMAQIIQQILTAKL